MVLTKFWNFICLKRVATVSTIVFILRTNRKYQGHCTCLLVMVLFLWWNRSLYKNAIIFGIDEFSYYILSDMPGGICSTYNAFEIEKSLLKRKKATFRFYFIAVYLHSCSCCSVRYIDRQAERRPVEYTNRDIAQVGTTSIYGNRRVHQGTAEDLILEKRRCLMKKEKQR